MSYVHIIIRLQSTIAVSKLVTNLLGQNDTNLRKSLSTIATFVEHDEKVKVRTSVKLPLMPTDNN